MTELRYANGNLIPIKFIEFNGVFPSKEIISNALNTIITKNNYSSFLSTKKAINDYIYTNNVVKIISNEYGNKPISYIGHDHPRYTLNIIYSLPLKIGFRRSKLHRHLDKCMQKIVKSIVVGTWVGETKQKEIIQYDKAMEERRRLREQYNKISPEDRRKYEKELKHKDIIRRHKEYYNRC